MSSASEKLRELDGAMVTGSTPWLVIDPEIFAQDADLRAAMVLEPIAVLRNALPLIADVVEAAEVFWSDDRVDGMKATENLDSALTALRDALEEK